MRSVACVAGGMRERASGPQYSVAGEAREDFASGEAASEILDSSPILSRLRHSLRMAWMEMD